ncbi:MAG TPA: XRE family transcriptional regulator [Steroidobacteraceae bacterium]|nr:XRE family transcriptional regulator [Steroidobacteraceae bacterium]
MGAEIRGLRKARNLTLNQLAGASGLSVGYLSMVERQQAMPSIKSLLSIAHALGVTIGWFFEGDAVRPQEHGLVVRRSRRRRIDYSAGIVDELLSPSLKGNLELVLCRLAPGASSGEEPYSHAGEEAGVVVRGRLELWVSGQSVMLETGDSFGFESTRPHRYRNPGPDETEIVWAITPPSY